MRVISTADGKQVQRISGEQRSESYTSSRPSEASELGHTLTKLLTGSLSKSSLNTYQRPWAVFAQFSANTFHTKTEIPISPDTLALFVAYLSDSGYAASTALTYISAIGYVHRLSSLPDPSKSELIRLALRGYAKQKTPGDARLRITLPILEQLLSAFDHTISSTYKGNLMKAMSVTAFFAALRIGEITIRNPTCVRNLIQLDQISFKRNRLGQVEAMQLSMKFFKHSDTSCPVVLSICPEKPVCPLSILALYLSLRGYTNGPLFCWPDNSPVRRQFFVNALNNALGFCGLDHKDYKTHSFRIGAASWAAEKGMSDSKIKLFGRWKSSAFVRYIRTPTLGSA
ncbi:uncharacterized protein LOC116289613 [Actinia tenebrosa]|uniref:Uncharacterized protein LOC116289613 n=1 Tax=Actinia tenebrosa TaxID=6105 RepID=A0A6P8HIF2_ACTTE|nr:uncharacterized protein LOC116289613 [Actinia tenebrosa]